MQFQALPFHSALQRALKEDHYLEPTPVQEAAIPVLLEGHDVMATAQTGTGKTAAFALPILQSLIEAQTPHSNRAIKALVLAPTRELALQIKDSFDRYSRKTSLRATAVYGGMPKRNQIIKIKRGVDILVATPGRLLDLMQMNVVKLNTVTTWVLDEVDQMLDMGFIDDVKKIAKAIPKQRQTMLFSATLPPAIETLASTLLHNPVRLSLAPQNQPLDTIDQRVFRTQKMQKVDTLNYILTQDSVTKALIFVKTKRYADVLSKQLYGLGQKAVVLHGDKSQRARQDALKAFKTNRVPILIATDVAARGLDIDVLSHVINFDMPATPETYLHRIGRTARAGKLGAAYNLCSSDENHLLKAIQKHIGFVIPVDSSHPFHVKEVAQRPKRTHRPSFNGSNTKRFQGKNTSKKSSMKQKYAH